MKKSSTQRHVWSWISFLSTALAICVHSYLTWEFYQLKLGLASGKSLCNVSSTFNCEVVAISQFAHFLSIPIALWGLWTNILLFFFLAVGNLKISAHPRKWSRLALVLSAFILISSLVMGSISAIYLKTYCLFCIAAYIFSLFQWISIWFLNQEFKETLTTDLGQLLIDSKSTVGVLVAVPAFAALSNFIILDSYGAGKLDLVIQESLNEWITAPEVTFDTEKGLSFQSGSLSPKVTLVEFIDLLCPHCKAASPTIHAFVEGRSDVRLVLKVFPLDGTCNSLMQRQGDGLRCQLSYQVFCAEKVSQKGWASLEWVFDHQHEFFNGDTSNLRERLSSDLQLPKDELKLCMESPETAALVSFMASEGGKAEIRGTPSVFLNGKRVDKAQLLPVLEAIYQHAKK